MTTTLLKRTIFVIITFPYPAAQASFLAFVPVKKSLLGSQSFLEKRGKSDNTGHFLWQITKGVSSERSNKCCFASEKNNEILNDIRSTRKFRQSGLCLGITFFTCSVLIGMIGNIIDPNIVLIMIPMAIILFAINTLSFNEYQTSLLQQQLAAASGDDTANIFQARESLIPNAGFGLFTTRSISKDTYLMEYNGEKLSEIEYFQRYPDGQGRYVACIDEPLPFLPLDIPLCEPIYIDGIDSTKESNLARYMNSKCKDDGANVYWKKQRWFGGKMYFYALRDIEIGEELCFDYGKNYWDAVK